MVAHRPDLREDVGAEDDGVVLGQVPDQIPDLHHLLGVQAHGGLVQNDDLGKAQDGLGQAHPLPVALGQVPDQPGAHVLQMGQGQDLIQLVLPLVLGDLLQLRAEAEILLHRHVGIQGRDLRQVPDAGPGGLRLLQNIVALHQHLALRGGQIAGHDIHRGGFSGAVRPQKAEDLAVLHREAQVVHRVVVPVSLHQIFDLDHTNNLLQGWKQAGPALVSLPSIKKETENYLKE